ncbi:hypothetical protein FS837_000377 [Tulasnella sp. UAMH 9824]|nr:hypothetical protein FS837_000377 [Tulasnella sp. UAMH 9824]
MVTTRGKKIKLDLDSSEGELDRERDDEVPGEGRAYGDAGTIFLNACLFLAAKPAPKRRRTKRSKSSEDDSAFNPGASSGKGKEKAPSDQNQLITRRNGRGGKLRDLMNMPVDIFTEVCSYLGPHDLRRLALTSKRLWAILMTKEAKHIWKAAIASTSGLPKCPTDLTEPQYVCLLYSSECYTTACTSRGTKVDWYHRVRFCSACHAKKMTNESDLSYGYCSIGRLTRGTINQVMVYFNSYPVMSLANSRQQGYTRKADEQYYYIEALKKAGRKYEALPRENVGGYLSRLKKMHDYRVKTGTAMLKWKRSQLASRADDIAAEKNARFQSIKVKLLELGWDEKDFPISNKEFRDLAFKDQKLTDKIWQNILPKLEAQLETHRNERLELEKEQRRSSRENATTKFYHQVGLEAINLPFELWNLTSLLPEADEVFALPSVKALLENDTETVTEEQWTEVAPDARIFVLKWWRDFLKQLTYRLKNNGTVPPNKTKQRTEGTTSDAETPEAISTSIESLQGKLSLTTAAWFCDGCHDKNVFWFPHAIRHLWECHGFYGMDSMLQPLRRDDQKLVLRLLKDSGLDPKTAKSEHPVEDDNEKNLLCTRCDERVARYMSWNEMVNHFLAAQRWYENATEAVRKSLDACYPSRTVKSKLPKIVNDHAWTARNALLVRQDDEKTKEAVLKLQSNFRKQGLNDPSCDTTGIGGEDLEQHPWREVKRYCLLCPKSYGPYACSTGKIELHIRRK